jgi:ParB-like chromosome segregation protein Spo0J
VSEDKKKGGRRPAIEKNNVVLDKLKVEYLPVDAVRPNAYNPNRQSDHDFELLCKSIAEDGFTQPIVVLRSTKEIVDGEHRWRACKALGYAEVPVVLTDMTPEQMRIATLRHNRARGSEDAVLAAEVLKELASLGAVDWAQDSLMLDDKEVKRLLQEMPADEVAQMDVEVPADMLGPQGRGLSRQDERTAVDTTADERRAKERILAQAKEAEESKMAEADNKVYRIVLYYTGEEAEVVSRALGGQDGHARAVLEMCRQAAG